MDLYRYCPVVFVRSTPFEKITVIKGRNWYGLPSEKRLEIVNDVIDRLC